MDRLAAEALEREGLAVVAHQRISAFGPARTQRHTYRVTLTDGRTIKVRRTLSDSHARRVCDVLREVEDDRFARVLSRQGAVLLEEWVEGIALSNATVQPEHIREAAGLLAKLHAVEAVGGISVRGEQGTEPRLAETEARLATLARTGAIGGAVAASLGDALRRFDPRRAMTGLVHLDFGFENMVIDTRGRLRVIDNEALAVDAFDYDLARAWFPGAMGRAAWAVFEEEYRRLGGPGAVTGSPIFWRIAAVAESAVTRLERNPDRAQAPLKRLYEMAADLRHPIR